jgi:cobalt-zinc-cadmium efflux system membrane fusion protein
MNELRRWVGLGMLCLIAVQGCSKKRVSEKADESGGQSKSSGGTSSKGANPQGEQDKSSKGGAQGNDVVRIPAEDQQRAGIQVAAVFVQQVPRTLAVAGQVQMDEQHTSHLGMIADGRITAVNVLPGALVRRGQVLGDLHSHAVHETVGALVQAYAAVDRQRGAVVFAKQAQDRYHHLYAIQAASLEESQRSDQETLQAQKMLVDAEANVRMEREHLSELLQVSPESLTPNNLYDKELIPIRSPIDGVVIARNITVGQVVDTGFEAFVISNLSTVWITAAVNEQDLPLIHVSVLADVVTQGYPDRSFHGRVAMIGDLLDAQTRTVPVRIVVPNPGTLLRPGMFASAHIAEPKTRVAIFVPQDALQDINGMKVVFVTRDGTTFQARTVDIGTQSAGKVEITNGLSAEDHIVVNGAFMVKSEMLKGTMGES